jgi:hypothetical protein
MSLVHIFYPLKHGRSLSSLLLEVGDYCCDCEAAATEILGAWTLPRQHWSLLQRLLRESLGHYLTSYFDCWYVQYGGDISHPCPKTKQRRENACRPRLTSMQPSCGLFQFLEIVSQHSQDENWI